MVSQPKETIAILDVGTTKLCCLIARVDGAGHLHIDGIGHQVSAGIKAGVVIDMEDAETAIRSVVHQAETMAERTIDDVIVVTSAGDIASAILTVEVAVSGHAVERIDINRVLKLARQQMAEEPRAIIHALPACYSVDQAHGVRQPEGMFGERLGVDFHMVTAEPGPLQNLETCIRRCHLNVVGMMAAPYASGLSCLHGEEKGLGVACVDFGGGSTSISVFCGGILVNSAVLPLGSDAITRDIAKMLSTPLNAAERLKTLYGSVIESAADHRELLDVTPVSDVPATVGGRIRKSQLTGLIRPRVEETLEYVADSLKATGFLGEGAGTVVLTGGGSQLPGIHHLAEHVLSAPVRFGYPHALPGLAEATSGPAFTAAVGAIMYAAQGGDEQDFAQAPNAYEGMDGKWPQRIVRWLREAI